MVIEYLQLLFPIVCYCVAVVPKKVLLHNKITPLKLFYFLGH